MLTPGPDHPIHIEPATRRWRALFEGHVIADTDDALVLREAKYPPVIYFPRSAVGMEYMGRTSHHTHCPYKGDASYYTLRMDSRVEENVAWSYEDPADAVSQIKDRIAFYPDRVEVYSVDDAAVNPHHREMSRREVDEVVRHTDEGDGKTQAAHWPPTEPPYGEEGGVR